MKPANLINAVLFQLNWFACVVGGTNDQLWWPLLTLSGMLLQSARSEYRRTDVYLVTGVAAIGLVLDTFWIQIGILDFSTGDLAPVWIVMMWMGVALTINHSLQWLQGLPILGGVLAAFSAPLCYLGGARLGAVQVDPQGLLLIAVTWFLLFSGLFTLARVTHGRQSAA